MSDLRAAPKNVLFAGTSIMSGGLVVPNMSGTTTINGPVIPATWAQRAGFEFRVSNTGAVSGSITILGGNTSGSLQALSDVNPINVTGPGNYFRGIDGCVELYYSARYTNISGTGSLDGDAFLKS